MPTIKPLPENHGNQILELFCVCRNRDADTVDIAEASDGAMKLYESKDKAERARRELAISGDADRDNPWTVETVWMLNKGSDISLQALAIAETGMFSESAVRSIDTLVKTMERRRG